MKKRAVLPPWFTERFPARYTARNYLTKIAQGNSACIRCRKRLTECWFPNPKGRLLEMLSEVGVHQGVEEARNIMEGIISLRTDTLANAAQTLSPGQGWRLLCVCWAEELSFPWATPASQCRRQPGTVKAGGPPGSRTEPF